MLKINLFHNDFSPLSSILSNFIFEISSFLIIHPWCIHTGNSLLFTIVRRTIRTTIVIVRTNGTIGSLKNKTNKFLSLNVEDQDEVPPRGLSGKETWLM